MRSGSTSCTLAAVFPGGRTPMLIGYVRVSKSDGSQTLAPQGDALLAIGVEADHLDGDTDLIGVVASLLREEARRAEEGRADATIPMRPDHGQLLIDDIGKKVNPGYSCIGRLKGLAELRGVMRTVAAFRAGRVC